MADFIRAFARTVGLEGGYSDDPNDPGGPTRYGITQAEARAAGYAGDMREFPISLAQVIYRDRYWKPIYGDALTDQGFAEKLFDVGVNCGVVNAVTWLQVGLNALNLRGARWADLKEDGLSGPATLVAFGACLAQGAEFRLALAHGYVGQQAVYYLGIGRRAQTQEDFELGWLAERCWLP